MSQDYWSPERCKRAWELMHSNLWRELVLPLLAERAERKPNSITSLDDAFKAAQIQGSSDSAANLIATIERMNDRHQSQSGG